MPLKMDRTKRQANIMLALALKNNHAYLTKQVLERTQADPNVRLCDLPRSTRQTLYATTFRKMWESPCFIEAEAMFRSKGDVATRDPLWFVKRTGEEKPAKRWLVRDREDPQRSPTLLHLAVANGCSVDVVKMLLDYKADVNARMQDDYTPLMLAVIGRQYEVTNLLLEHNARVDAMTVREYTPLMFAVQAGDQLLTASLLFDGADPNLAMQTGLSPLHIAVIKKNYTIAHMLLQCGASANAYAFHSMTPLHFACMHNSKSTVEMLLDAGAQPRSVFEDGLVNIYPLPWVVPSGQYKMTHVVVEWMTRRRNRERSNRILRALFRKMRSGFGFFSKCVSD